jgi:hypothetical protein
MTTQRFFHDGYANDRPRQNGHLVFTFEDLLHEYEEALMAVDPADRDSVARVEGTRYRLALGLIRHDVPGYEPDVDDGALLRWVLEDVFATWEELP